MKRNIHLSILRSLGCLLVLPFLLNSCLFEEPEITADGEKGADPTAVNVTAELTLDMQLASLELPRSRAAEESEYRHRFIITAYEGKEVAAQQTIYEDIHPDRPALTLPVSLKLYARKYQLVVWADYIKKDSEADVHYMTADMDRILRAASYAGNSGYLDAFYGSTRLDLTSYRNQWNAQVPADIRMIRPLARYELIATDAAEFLQRVKKGEIAGKTFTATVKYNYYLTTGFSTLTGKVKHPLMYMQYSKVLKFPEEGAEECNIGFDYVFVNGESSFVSLTVEIANEKGAVVARCKSLKIPYEQGHTTTARGKFLTSNPKPGIDFDTDFDKDINVDLDRL